MKFTTFGTKEKVIIALSIFIIIMMSVVSHNSVKRYEPNVSERGSFSNNIASDPIDSDVIESPSKGETLYNSLPIIFGIGALLTAISALSAMFKSAFTEDQEEERRLSRLMRFYVHMFFSLIIAGIGVQFILVIFQ